MQSCLLSNHYIFDTHSLSLQKIHYVIAKLALSYTVIFWYMCVMIAHQIQFYCEINPWKVISAESKLQYNSKLGLMCPKLSNQLICAAVFPIHSQIWMGQGRDTFHWLISSLSKIRQGWKEIRRSSFQIKIQQQPKRARAHFPGIRCPRDWWFECC